MAFTEPATKAVADTGSGVAMVPKAQSGMAGRNSLDAGNTQWGKDHICKNKGLPGLGPNTRKTQATAFPRPSGCPATGQRLLGGVGASSQASQHQPS